MVVRNVGSRVLQAFGFVCLCHFLDRFAVKLRCEFAMPTLLLMFLALCATGALGQQIKYCSGNYGGTMIEVGTGVSIAKVNQASFSGGSAGITFNLGSMMTSAQPIVIEVCGLTLSNGAIMYFLGASSVAGKKPAYITITGVTSNDGGIGLGAGTFPWYTRLIAKTVTYSINSGAAAFSKLSSYGASSPTCLLTAGLTLQKTVVRFTAQTIGGTRRSGVFPIRYNAFVCSDYSVWMVDNSNIGVSFAVHGHNPTITSNSLLLISKVNAACDRFCISFESGVTVSDGGAFIVDDSTASADGQDLLFISGPLTVAGGGLFMAAGNYFITPRYAFSISSGGSTSGTNSLISFVNNNLLGLPWHMGCSGNCRVQCNMLGQAQLSTIAQYQTAGLNTASVASPCDVRTKCAAYTVGCYLPLTASGGTSPNCCICKPGGYGKYCLPVELPNIPEMCVATATVPIVTKTHVLTQTEMTPSATVTQSPSESGSGSPSTSESPSAAWSGSPTGTQNTTELRLTVTHSRLRTPTPTLSMTYSLTRAVVATPSLTQTDSLSHIEQSVTLSLSMSSTATPTTMSTTWPATTWTVSISKLTTSVPTQSANISQTPAVHNREASRSATSTLKGTARTNYSGFVSRSNNTASRAQNGTTSSARQSRTRSVMTRSCSDRSLRSRTSGSKAARPSGASLVTQSKSTPTESKVFAASTTSFTDYHNTVHSGAWHLFPLERISRRFEITNSKPPHLHSLQI
jgi:hypothetical protein